MAPLLELLVADADGRTSAALERLSRELGCSVRTTSSVEELRAVLARGSFDACLVDTGLTEARALLADLANRSDAPEPVALVEAGSSGDVPAAFERLVRPIDRPALEACLFRVQRTRGLRSALFREQGRRGIVAGDLLLGDSPARARLVEEVERVAGTPRTTVLVRGPRGSGKELVARAIHARSGRAAGPFLAVSCAGGKRGEGPDLGSALFAGTGGGNLLRAAQGGTLFLSQAGCLYAELQAALLAFLEERSYGGRDHAEIDVRLVAASNPDLEELVHRGVFREDLLYRLNVLAVRVPQLAERREDVPAVANAILGRTAVELGRSIAGFSPEAVERLRSYGWPGNLRELALAVERAALLAPGDVVPAEALALGGERRTASGDALVPADRTLRGMEEALIKRTLAEEAGNRSRAARVLGIDRTTLYHKLRRYGIG